jgi:peptidyl-prolyl cis-trans isomerase D
MLKLMRKKAQSWIIKVLFAVIIIVFVFFYGFSRRTGQRKVIAEVNGAKITTGVFRGEYEKSLQSMIRLYQQIYGEQFNESMIDRAMLGQRVLSDLIDETLLGQEAEELSLQVSPEEIQAAVRSIPAFQVDGQFDRGRFLAILQSNNLTLEEFQEMEERQLRIAKLTDLIGLGAAELSEQEILDTYLLEHEKIRLQFVRFNPADDEESLSVDESELEAYFSENRAQFETPPMVQVRYLVFSTGDFLGRVEVSAEEIREEYEYNHDQYRVPGRAKVSHILISTPVDKDETATEKARKRAEEILEQIRQGADFATLAREHSDDKDSVEKGGSLGWVTQSEDLPEFLAVAFSLEKEEISPLIESEEGFHIVKADDLQEGRVKRLEEVEDEIRNELAREKGRILAEEAAQEAFFEVYDSRDLEGFASQNNLEVKTTRPFGREERLDEVKGNLEFNNQAFSLREDDMSSPLQIGEEIYLMKVVNRQPPQIPPFEEVKEKVREEVLQQRALEHARTAAEEMLEKAKQGASLTELADSSEKTVEDTGYFERSGTYIPKIGPSQVVGEAIFSLSPEHRLLEDVTSYGGMFFVIELKDEQKADMNQFESEREAYVDRLRARKRDQILQGWLEHLREKAEIKIREQNIPF